MTLTTWIPLAAVIGFVLFTGCVALGWGATWKGIWMLPAALSVLFLVLSVAAVVVEGPFGFWGEHTRNLWGNQIWLDLLFAVGVGWASLAPQAKAFGMRLVPWLLVILCTGSIGLLAMVSRMLYLRERTQPTAKMTPPGR